MANLPKRAPRTYAFLQQELARLEEAVMESDGHEAMRERHAEEQAKRWEASAANNHLTHVDEL